MSNKVIHVSHYLGLTGVGGVQSNFVEYLENALESQDKINHKVYTLGGNDFQYNLPIKIYDIKSITNLLFLILDIISNDKIVHFYNNLTSLKVALFLAFIPARKLIVHERGSAWNLKSKYGFILKFIVWKSDLILANSSATKLLLEKKFDIPKNKIKVIHNGVNVSSFSKKISKNPNKDNIFFNIGFIGRLDSHKGVHILVHAMQKLALSNIKLIIAGDGVMREELEKKFENLNNIQFLGRIEDPYVFFENINLLVVPSIREPLGNVCIEAGLSRTPVLAANIDGIPEIITNFFTGELINPTQPLEPLSSKKFLPFPEYVIDPSNNELIKPMQIDPNELADKILYLSKSPRTLTKYSENLYINVVNNFNIIDYTKKLHAIYVNLKS